MSDYGRQTLGTYGGIIPISLAAAGIWADGLDGQEDELEDVHKGILDAPTDNEGAGEVNEANDSDVDLKKQDEGEDLIKEMLRNRQVQ